MTDVASTGARLANGDALLLNRRPGGAPAVAAQPLAVEEVGAEVTVFAATDVIGDSSDAAYREAQRWLASEALVRR